MTPFLKKLKEIWRSLSGLDLAALAFVLGGVVLTLADLTGGVFSFLKFLALLALGYLLFRVIGWWRTRLLWSLRNRLIVAYVFMGIVPILLIVLLVVQAARILYSQLGAYLLYEDIQRRIEMIADISEHIAAAHRTLPKGVKQKQAEQVLADQSHAVHDRELPGLAISFSDDISLLHDVAGEGKQSFAGLMQRDDPKESLSLTSMRVLVEAKGQRMVMLRVPVKPEFLASIAPDLGGIQLNLMERYTGGPTKSVIYQSGLEKYLIADNITARNRTLQPAAFWFDGAINIVSRLDCVFVGRSGLVEPRRPLFAISQARPSRLNSRIFTSLGELRESYVALFVFAGIVFLIIEVAALITGIILTQRITKAVGDLYQATQYVQAGDLSHRVPIDKRDQLGVLGESFNSMTGSVSGLIEEQKQRQKLQNEISIAREVQNQLFPMSLPSVPGVEIEAICKAARTVSGDYYDFIQLSPTHVALAIADISGKGISAALLMASLQAALRSQVLTPESACMNTAELVSRLNKHLVRNTGDDRFATFFIAVYDSATRTLRYTNAGHLPSLLICNGAAKHLDVGGMVLGVVEEYEYAQGSVQVPENALLIGYSDGLVEPENVYGEEFGIRRLQEAATRAQANTPLMVAESLMAAAEEWAGTPEQADDMTVIVARLR